MVHGVFIGIDKYSSTTIRDLSCCKRDAALLYSLFKDNFADGNFSLLADEEASLDRIEVELTGLSIAAPDDMVVFFFSGHGSSTHRLVTHNADRQNFDATSLSLEYLTEWFSQLAAKNAICFLDCCFSGGMGAKVLTLEYSAKDLESTSAILEKISGEGRVIFTASKADQKAYENRKVGHGFFTYYLAEALCGVDEVIQDGVSPLLRLFDYVCREVTVASKAQGRHQDPTFRGRINDRLVWPPLVKGNSFKSFFPSNETKITGAQTKGLQDVGLPVKIVNLLAEKIPELNKLQQTAINDYGLFTGGHLVVSAPTSSGKTLIGELAALNSILSENGKAIFLFPLKALVNDKYHYFTEIYGSFGIRTIRATGESVDDIPALMQGKYDICLMTYEKFTAMMLGYPFLLEQVTTVVVDEVQMLSDKSRGANLEFTLTLIMVKRHQGIEPQLILLSAVIGDTNGFEDWLEGSLLMHPYRPVPLDEGLILKDGSYRFIASDTNEEHKESEYIRRLYTNKNRDFVIPLARKLVAEEKQVIVFRPTRSEVRFVAEYLAKSLSLPAAEETIALLPEGDTSSTSQLLKSCLGGGVAIHTADLEKDERAVVEQQFNKSGSDIRIIVATTTLAMGVNTPAEAVIVVGLERRTREGVEPYSIAEYKNIIGRAGRLGFANRGQSYLIAGTDRDELDFWQNYVLGTPEDIESRFLSENTDPRSLILRVLTTGRRKTMISMNSEEILLFLEGSFAAFCQKRNNPEWSWNRSAFEAALKSLIDHGLVRIEEEGLAMTKLGWIVGQSGLETESAIRVLKVLKQMSLTDLNEPSMISLTQITTELDDVYFPINRKSKHKEPAAWIAELRKQPVSEQVLTAFQYNIEEASAATLRAKKAAATLLWISNTDFASIEKIVTRFGGFDAAGPIRKVGGRVYDILPIIYQLANHFFPEEDFAARRNRILARLECGVPAALAHLAEIIGNRLSRADYFNLLAANLTEIETLQGASMDSLMTDAKLTPEKAKIVKSELEKHFSNEEPEIPVPMLPEFES